jgi:hypothetical protein
VNGVGRDTPVPSFGRLAARSDVPWLIASTRVTQASGASNTLYRLVVKDAAAQRRSLLCAPANDRRASSRNAAAKKFGGPDRHFALSAVWWCGPARATSSRRRSPPPGGHFAGSLTGDPSWQNPMAGRSSSSGRPCSRWRRPSSGRPSDSPAHVDAAGRGGAGVDRCVRGVPGCGRAPLARSISSGRSAPGAGVVVGQVARP